MRKLYDDWRGTWHTRPGLAVLGVIYALVPFVISGLLIYSVAYQRPEIGREARRNCQRSAAIANYIRRVTAAHPEAQKTPDFKALRDLERTLRSIGSCPT